MQLRLALLDLLQAGAPLLVGLTLAISEALEELVRWVGVFDPGDVSTAQAEQGQGTR